MEDINDQLKSMLEEINVTRYETLYLSNIIKDVVNKFIAELTKKEEAYKEVLKNCDNEEELFKRKLEYLQITHCGKSVKRVVELIEREVGKIRRRDNELREKLDYFCKRYHIDLEKN